MNNLFVANRCLKELHLLHLLPFLLGGCQEDNGEKNAANEGPIKHVAVVDLGFVRFAAIDLDHL